MAGHTEGPVPVGAEAVEGNAEGEQTQRVWGNTPAERNAQRRKIAAHRLRRLIEQEAVRRAAEANAVEIASHMPVNHSPTPPLPKGGRPRQHDRIAIFDSITAELAKGKTFDEACRYIGISPSTARNWAYSDPYCRAEYAKCKRLQADALADRAIREANRAVGKDAPGVAAQRLRVDTLRWYVSHLDPSRYGSRPDRDGGGERVVRIVFDDDEPLERAPAPSLPAGEGAVEDADYSIEGPETESL